MPQHLSTFQNDGDGVTFGAVRKAASSKESLRQLVTNGVCVQNICSCGAAVHTLQESVLCPLVGGFFHKCKAYFVAENHFEP